MDVVLGWTIWICQYSAVFNMAQPNMNFIMVGWELNEILHVGGGGEEQMLTQQCAMHPACYFKYLDSSSPQHIPGV